MGVPVNRVCRISRRSTACPPPLRRFVPRLLSLPPWQGPSWQVAFSFRKPFGERVLYRFRTEFNSQRPPRPRPATSKVCRGDPLVTRYAAACKPPHWRQTGLKARPRPEQHPLRPLLGPQTHVTLLTVSGKKVNPGHVQLHVHGFTLTWRMAGVDSADQ